MATNRSMSGKAGERDHRLSANENTAVFAPIPTASVTTTARVYPGFFNRSRTANLRFSSINDRTA
jgi:hypothetical protein